MEEQSYYILKEGQQKGPFSIREIDALLQSEFMGGEDLCWCPEFGEAWKPISSLPGFIPAVSAPPPLPPPIPPLQRIAPANPPNASDAQIQSLSPLAKQPALQAAGNQAANPIAVPTRPAEDTAGVPHQLLTVPFVGAALIWLHPAAATWISLGTVVTTAILVFKDAKRLGIGSASDLNDKGRKRSGPGQWCAFTLLLWAVGYPSYMFARTRRAGKNFGWLGIVAALTFLVSLNYFPGVSAAQPEGVYSYDGPVSIAPMYSQNETISYDIRSNGSFLFQKDTPYGPNVFAGPYGNQHFQGTWTMQGNEIVFVIDGKEFNRMKQEGIDLIAKDGTRYIRVR